MTHAQPAAVLLNGLQHCLAGINDAPVPQTVSDFHLADRNTCSALLGRALETEADEQVLMREDAGGMAMSVYIDRAVIDRLLCANPLQQLASANLADYCAAMEGISHFHYIAWCIARERQLSLLELELQAEVDKYAVAVCLLRRQGCRDLPGGLLRRLFSQVRLITGLSCEARQRYTEANRAASSFCKRLDARYLCASGARPEAWLRALQRFYRCSHHQKLRQAAH